MLGGLTFDNRDNQLDATRGYFVEALVEPFYEFNYGNAAARFTAEGRTYYGFGEEDPIVLAGRLKIGSHRRRVDRRDRAGQAVLRRRRRLGARLCIPHHRRRHARSAMSSAAAR